MSKFPCHNLAWIMKCQVFLYCLTCGLAAQVPGIHVLISEGIFYDGIPEEGRFTTFENGFST